MAIRLSLSTVVGGLVTVLLFYLMQALIHGAGSALTEDNIGYLVDFVRIQKIQEIKIKDRTPKKPPMPDEPPPELKPSITAGPIDEIVIGIYDPVVGPAADPSSGFISDGEYLPIVKVQPQYPRRPLSRGMSGWAIVEFTVTTMGTVSDVRVVENCAWIKNTQEVSECVGNPNSAFDSAAVKAASKFKYKPKVVDGNPIATAGVRNKITFELNDI